MKMGETLFSKIDFWFNLLRPNVLPVLNLIFFFTCLRLNMIKVFWFTFEVRRFFGTAARDDTDPLKFGPGLPGLLFYWSLLWSIRGLNNYKRFISPGNKFGGTDILGWTIDGRGCSRYRKRKWTDDFWWRVHMIERFCDGSNGSWRAEKG